MPEYLEIAAKKQAILKSLIPEEWKLKELPKEDNVKKFAETCGILTPKEVEITSNYDSTALLKEIHSGKYTAKEVTIAFCKRTAIAQQVLNCLTEIMFDDAIKVAEEQDKYFQETGGKVKGPLHGLPISLKDSMNVKGIESTIAMTANAFIPEEKNSGITDALIKAGAIIFCKTNVPQSMMVLDTDNFLFGRAVNPHSKYITTAGSSGGAGALVAFRGCLIGMATDIGGSIRVPAYANGVYGFKPSSGRMPYYNIKGYWAPGEEYCGVLCVEGPIAVSMRDCELLIKAVNQTEPWLYDPTCHYSPWPELKNEPEKKLAIGYFDMECYEPVSSMFKESLNKFEAAGHELVKLDFLKVDELVNVANSCFQAGGGEFLIRKGYETGEPLTDTVLDNGLYPCDRADLTTYFSYNGDKMELMKLWADYLESTNKMTKSGKPVDCLFMPTNPCVPRYKEYLGSPFIIPWNTLDYPAMVFPVDTIDLKKHKVEMPPPANKAEQKVEKYYPEDRTSYYQGFPVGLQLVGRRLQEAELFKNFKILSQTLDNVY